MHADVLACVGGGYDKLLADVPMGRMGGHIDASLPFGDEGRKKERKK